MIMKPKSDSGYLRVELRKGKKGKLFLIHRLVLKAFLYESNLEVNHIDGIKGNNKLENLEYATSSENQKHAYKIGLQTALKGEKSPSHKLNNDIIKNIRENIYNLTTKEFAVCYAVSVRNIRKILNNESWRHVS